MTFAMYSQLWGGWSAPVLGCYAVCRGAGVSGPKSAAVRFTADTKDVASDYNPHKYRTLFKGRLCCLLAQVSTQVWADLACRAHDQGTRGMHVATASHPHKLCAN